MINPPLPRLRSLPPPWVVGFWLLVAAAPVVYVALEAAAASRNIVYWDEFDTALGLLIQIASGAGPGEVLQKIFAIANEHRIATSRALFAASYWLTGTVNFHVIGAIGNLFFVVTFALLVREARTAGERLRLAVVLSLGVVHLGQFENFLWSGASIDHLQVPMLAIAAGVGLTRGTSRGLGWATIAGLLATFTLAHGLLIWPLGGLWLARCRRWRDLAVWGGFALVALAVFFAGFEVNAGENIPPITVLSLGRIAAFWLTLMGAPLTFGQVHFAWLPGLLLPAAVVALVRRGLLQHRPAYAFTLAFTLGSLALVALGRAGLVEAQVNSRYLILGSLAWALVLHLTLEDVVAPMHPFLVLAGVGPLLAGFNIASNLHFRSMVEAFLEFRDRAATSYVQHGKDGQGFARLHPDAGHAEKILRRAEELGVYRMPAMTAERPMPRAVINRRIISQFDELWVNDLTVMIGGWAMLPGVVSRRGQISVVLRSGETRRVFSVVTLPRPDVVKAYRQPDWRLAGFRAVIPRELLPAGDWQVGVLLEEGGRRHYLPTGHWVTLRSSGLSPAGR